MEIDTRWLFSSLLPWYDDWINTNRINLCIVTTRIHCHVTKKVNSIQVLVNNACESQLFTSNNVYFRLSSGYSWKKKYNKYLNLRETPAPSLRIHAECFDYFTYRSQLLPISRFGTLALRHRYHVCIVNIWNVKCTGNNSHFRLTNATDVLVKLSKFLRQKSFDHRGTRIPNLHAECSIHLSHPLRWRHNERDSVSNHQPRMCLLNRLFKHRSKKTSKLRVTGLCAGNSPLTG